MNFSKNFHFFCFTRLKYYQKHNITTQAFFNLPTDFGALIIFWRDTWGTSDRVSFTHDFANRSLM